MIGTKQIGFAFVSLIFNSCFAPVPLKYKMQFSNCFDGTNTGIELLMNVEGYYKNTKIEKRNVRFSTKGQWKIQIDTIETNILFYKDGTFLYQFFDHNKNIPYYFKAIVENPKSDKSFWFYKACNWGKYNICGDTLKARYINHCALLAAPWIANERWYKIIDKNSIKEIAIKSLSFEHDKSEMNVVYYNEKEQKISYFFPVETIPNSDCWLKKKKWFWKQDKLKKY